MGVPRIVVVGSSNTDFTVASDRLPPPGATVTGGRFYESGGGKGANQAVAAGRAGAYVSFIGKVGKDWMGRSALKRLHDEGIDTGGVVTDPEAHSGIALIMVDGQGENLISVAPGANHRLSPEDVENGRGLFHKADAVLVQLEAPLETVEAALDTARKLGVMTILDPAPVPEDGLPDPLLGKVDVLTPNRLEATALAGLKDNADPLEAAGLLSRKVESMVAVTLGADGVLLYRGEQGQCLPGAVADPVDTVGAGDCFAGVLAVALAEGKKHTDAVSMALCAAALSTEKEGAQPSFPFRKTIEERMESYRK